MRLFILGLIIACLTDLSGVSAETLTSRVCYQEIDRSVRIDTFLHLADGSIVELRTGRRTTKLGDVYVYQDKGAVMTVGPTFFSETSDSLVDQGPCFDNSALLMTTAEALAAYDPDAVQATFGDHLNAQSAKEAALASVSAKEALRNAERDALAAAAALEAAKATAAQIIEDAKKEADAGGSLEVREIKRTNDELKIRICKLDPKATFAVCPDVRAGIIK